MAEDHLHIQEDDALRAVDHFLASHQEEVGHFPIASGTIGLLVPILRLGKRNPVDHQVVHPGFSMGVSVQVVRVDQVLRGGEVQVALALEVVVLSDMLIRNPDRESSEDHHVVDT